MVFCFEIRGCFGGVRTVPRFGLFFRSRRACSFRPVVLFMLAVPLRSPNADLR